LLDLKKQSFDNELQEAIGKIDRESETERKRADIKNPGQGWAAQLLVNKTIC
jgi:hypothetical protein